jgi:hypothetical protein
MAQNTHAFKRETENYKFELKKTDLHIKLIGDFSELTFYADAGYSEYSHSKGMPVELIVYNYLERIKTDEASQVVNTVLSAFYRTFKPQGDQREQLRKSLRYFSLADHYGVLKAAFPNEIIEGVREKYNELVDKLTHLENDVLLTEALIKKSHINEPLVATTGLVVYAALNDNWLMFETNERHSTLPEYLYSVLHHSDFKISTNVSLVFTGTSSECQKYILDRQKDVYGVSLSEFKNLVRKLESNIKLAEDFEVLLDLDFDSTITGKREKAEKESALERITENNLHHLNFDSKETGANNEH